MQHNAKFYLREALWLVSVAQEKLGSTCASIPAAFERRLLQVAGRVLRWTHAYALAASVPRSEVGVQPSREEKNGTYGRGVTAQLTWLAKWVREGRPAKALTPHHDRQWSSTGTARPVNVPRTTRQSRRGM